MIVVFVQTHSGCSGGTSEGQCRGLERRHSRLAEKGTLRTQIARIPPDLTVCINLSLLFLTLENLVFLL